jgi:hypothetical protein
MTFKEITKMEPRLRQLYNEARQVNATDEYFCANDTWYRRFKPRLMRLVGWYAENPELRTCKAYDVAYDTIYDQLPGCRNCACIRLEDIAAFSQRVPN